jgi:hypothetical protein
MLRVPRNAPSHTAKGTPYGNALLTKPSHRNTAKEQRANGQHDELQPERGRNGVRSVQEHHPTEHQGGPPDRHKRRARAMAH